MIRDNNNTRSDLILGLVLEPRLQFPDMYKNSPAAESVGPLLADASSLERGFRAGNSR
jgi:hypothetical protein